MSQYGKEAWKTLQQYNLAPKKRFGQNFLVHRQTAEAIVATAQVRGDETIVEVGVGLGALTLPLSQAAKKVCAFEIDSGLVRFHQQSADLAENVTIIHQDILKANFAELQRNYANSSGKIKIVANLPYSISNPFLFKLIDNAQHIELVTVMLQKEVALRLTASVGSKEYGVPTILLASCATVTKKLLLKPDEFYPKPKIDSLVVTIDFNNKTIEMPPSADYDFVLFKDIVRTTFNQRRKIIANTLINIHCLRDMKKSEKSRAKIIIGEVLEKARIAPSARPETLKLIDFIRLAQHFAETKSI